MSDMGLDRRLGRSAALARNWWAIVLRGIVAVVFGILAFIEPVVALSSVVFVFGIYALVDGVFAIVAGIRAAAHHERWTALALEGVLGLLAGAAALFAPALAIVVWITVMAVWAIVTGVLMLSAAFQLHSSHGHWLLGLGGLVSVLWGAMLFFFPIGGAVVLTIWLGAYALVFGLAMIALGVRLHGRHRSSGGLRPTAV